MIIIQNINSQKFSLNGIPYFKNFMPQAIIAVDKLRIVNVYDTKFELVPYTSLNELSINGIVYNTASEAQNALLPIIYTRNNLGSETNFDDKLDKGGYIGTAQDLADSIESVLIPDQVLKTGGIVITDLTASIAAADFQWRLSSIEFLNPPAFSTEIDPATDGFNRTDIIEGDNTGNYHLKKGTEDELAAPEPEVTDGRIRLAAIPIFGAIAGVPIVSPIGDNFITKASQGGWHSNFDDLVINIDDETRIVLAACTEINYINHTTPSNAYNGRELFVSNRNDDESDILINNLFNHKGNFSFPNNAPFLLKFNETIHFKLYYDFGNKVTYYYVGVINAIPSIEISDVTGLTGELANKVDKDGVKVLSDENYTTSEKNKLASIDAAHYLPPLQTTVQLSALPQAGISDKARVYVEADLSDYFYDTTASSGDIAPDDQTGGIGFWRKVAVGGETPTSILTKYESNADRNAFTNALKAKLDSITEIFTTALKTGYDGVVTGYTALMATGSRLITTGEITKLGNTSGTNTGDQDLSSYAHISVTPIEIGSATTLSSTHNGAPLIIIASCTVTIPNGLAAGFNCSFITLAGVTLTIALGGSVVLFNNAGLTMAEKLSFTLQARTITNNYITAGSL